MHRYRDKCSLQKKLGAVYTPPRVASALVRWAVRCQGESVLDPSCGEGVFLAAARTRLADLGSASPVCVGVDIDARAAAAAGAVCADFFDWVRDQAPFDVVVGNPPFIRSHLFAEASRRRAFEQMIWMGVEPSRLMSAWAPFLALACSALSAHGRLAMIVPEELLHVSYARVLREFLLRRFRRVIVCLPPPGLFPSVQQAVVLLLCDNHADGQKGLLTTAFERLEEGDWATAEEAPPCEWNPKWTHLFLSPGERSLVSDGLRQLGWLPLRAYGRVEVGIVTGANDFFILRKDSAGRIGERYVAPIVTGARELEGLQLTNEDFAHLANDGRPAFLINTSEPLDALPSPLRAYIEAGVTRRVNQRFKCRGRQPWYAVPSVWPADALLLRQAGDVPRLVHLVKKCAATDTVHRVRWNEPSVGKRHAAAFMNTWTLLACELMGRSYGGGVLELMPSEANAVPVPPPVAQLDAIFDEVDAHVRNRRPFDAIATVDAALKSRSIPRTDLEAARGILARLIERRQCRANGRH